MPDRGVTLIEILVVLGMGTILISAGSFVSAGQLSAIGMRQDYETLTDTLLLARSQSQSGFSEESSDSVGVHVSTRAITIFQGSSYTERDRSADFTVPRTTEIENASQYDFVFHRGSGRAAEDVAILFDADPDLGINVSETGIIAPL